MTAFFIHRENRMIAIRLFLNRRKAAGIRCRLRSPGSEPALAVAQLPTSHRPEKSVIALAVMSPVRRSTVIWGLFIPLSR